MSLKACVYVNCENYVIDGVPSGGNFTLFQFPKDAHRRRQWMELGKVLPNVQASLLYMCSDHFDRKYISTNKRRSVLIGAAVPYDAGTQYHKNRTEAMKEIEAIDEEEESSFYVLLGDNELEVETDEMPAETKRGDTRDEYQVGSTMQDDDDEDGNEIHDNESIYNNDEGNDALHNEETETSYAQYETEKVVASTSKNIPKRKMFETGTNVEQPMHKRVILNKVKIIPQQKIHIKKDKISTAQLETGKEAPVPAPSQTTTIASVPKRIKPENSRRMSTHSPQTTTATPSSPPPEKPEIDVGNIIDSKHITTFIFKGEEYVQMPKDYYVQEKLVNLRKITQYERVLKTMKEYVNALNFY